MAKVTDIQDKNGVSKEIQDKDLANQTSVTAVGSTDYVMLEGADGAYHKIVKASFNEAVRAALGSVINSTAKGTDIAKLPVLDSNNDLGMGTLANLASVLGGAFMKNSVSDVNNLKSFEYTEANNSMAANMPTNDGSYYIVFSYRNEPDNQTGDGYQIAMAITGEECVYFRKKTNGTWYAWYKLTANIPSFYKDYANLSSLASALGVNQVSYYETIANRTTIDQDVQGYGLYMLWEHSTNGCIVLIFTCSYREGNSGGIKTIFDFDNFKSLITKPNEGNVFHVNASDSIYSLMRLTAPVEIQ